jgi:superfamily I DNA and/or RNA helicase
MLDRIKGSGFFISKYITGYAIDSDENSDGKIDVRFGALNQQGGENRLNVAITRAKREIIITCSSDPYNIYVDKVKNEGARRLKDYSCYAKAKALH